MVKESYLQAISLEINKALEATESVQYKDGVLIVKNSGNYMQMQLPELAIEPKVLQSCWALYSKLIYPIKGVEDLTICCYLSALEYALSNSVRNHQLRSGVITYMLGGVTKEVSHRLDYIDLAGLFYLRESYHIKEVPEQGCWIITAPSQVQRISTTLNCSCAEYTARRSCPHILLAQFCCRHRRDLLRLDLLEL